jgi:hypothetical protein
MYRLKRRHGLRTMRRPADRAGVTRSTVAHAVTGPNQVWSREITWLPTTIRGRYLYLDVEIDVWSRRIVGWAVHERESADHAVALARASGLFPFAGKQEAETGALARRGLHRQLAAMGRPHPPAPAPGVADGIGEEVLEALPDPLRVKRPWSTRATFGESMLHARAPSPVPRRRWRWPACRGPPSAAGRRAAGCSFPARRGFRARARRGTRPGRAVSARLPGEAIRLRRAPLSAARTFPAPPRSSFPARP